MHDFLSFLLLIIVIACGLYLLSDFIFTKPLACAAPLVLLNQVSGGNQHKYNSNRPDNIEVSDEYDDLNMLEEIDYEKIKTFDNIVIDGNNFIYRLKETLKNNSKLDAKEYTSIIRKSVKLIDKHFPNKNVYFVFKDPETEKQEKDLLELFKVDKVRQAHKSMFNSLVKEYPKIRFVVAYGDEKYRDDYAAIWLADTLPDDTILLSRDRYKDVSQMASSNIKFKTYGKRATAIDKIINKPFNYITKGSVKSALIGYSFSKKRKSGFYDRRVSNRNSSDVVYIFNL
jgi:hypothetical protein